MKTETELLKQLQERLDQISASNSDTVDEGLAGDLIKWGAKKGKDLYGGAKSAVKNIGRGFKGERPRDSKGHYTEPGLATMTGRTAKDLVNVTKAHPVAVPASIAGTAATVYALGPDKGEKGKDQKPMLDKPVLPDIPTVDDEPTTPVPASRTDTPRSEPAPKIAPVAATPTPTPEPASVPVSMPAPVARDSEKVKEPEITKKSDEFEFTPAQEKWLGGANRKDPYIINRMPDELGPKPTLPKPDYEKSLLRSLDPTNPRFMENLDRQLQEELSRITDLAGLKKK